jgi:hypothetical protein
LNRLIPGQFTLDSEFDGFSRTRAKGIIYLTTGAGGKHLYDSDYTDAPDRWLHAEDGRVAYVARMVADRHSFTLFEIDGNRALLRQIDQFGAEIDRITVEKA